VSERDPKSPLPGIARRVWPWLLVVVLGGALALVMRKIFDDVRGAEKVEWATPRALVMLAGAALVGVVGFALHRRRAATMAFSQVGLVGARGVGAWLADVPAVLRVLAIGTLAVALARPETSKEIRHKIDSIDIMVVLDMSKSMEETDMPRNRLDAAQRVIRRFLARSDGDARDSERTVGDRYGLVIFGQQAMLQCPLTSDRKMLDQIVADLQIGDVPELGTAIGDGLALALAQLRRSDAKSKVVVLLSDGDWNWATQFEPDAAARLAKDMGVKVYTLLVGREESDFFGGMSVNPATLRSIAQITDGQFFRAASYEQFKAGFKAIRKDLQKTERVEKERVPDHQLFVPLAIAAAILLVLEHVLATTRLRRLP
jgi:Ca-activated chloride channel family protein